MFMFCGSIAGKQIPPVVGSCACMDSRAGIRKSGDLCSHIHDSSPSSCVALNNYLSSLTPQVFLFVKQGLI